MRLPYDVSWDVYQETEGLLFGETKPEQGI
jgi:hypothetical protein